MTSAIHPLPQRYADRASVSTIREVFDYIRRYRDKTFVLKLDDALLKSVLFPLLMKDIVQLHDTGIRLIIVTGTRVTIDRNLKLAGLTTRMEKGIRITPDAAMPHIKLAAISVVETLISHLAAGGAHGIMGNWTRARALGVLDGVDYQWTGQVEKIRADIIHRLLDQDFIPVIYNIGLNRSGDSYNLNSNQIARQLCLDLEIEKLFFIRGRRAIPVLKEEIPAGAQIHPSGDIFSNLDLGHVTALLHRSDGTSDPNPVMDDEDRELLTLAGDVIATPGGVKRVHIVDGRNEGRILQEVFTSMGGGTMINGNRYAHIRKATLDDAPEILHLLEAYMKKGNLIPRTQREISSWIESYVIYEVDHAVYGCGALYDQGRGWGEIGAIAVNRTYKSKGVGHGIMQYLIRQAEKMGMHTLFLLTTRAADWFFEFGFKPATPADLPPHRRDHYNTRRNSRVLLLPLSIS